MIADSRARLSPLTIRLIAAARYRMQSARNGLAQHVNKLDAVSPLAVLGRGYAIVVDADRKLVSDASQLNPGDELELRLKRGRLRAMVREVDPGAADAADRN